MPVPSSINDLSTTDSSNSPAGTETPRSADNYLRAHAAFIAQLRDGKTTAATLAGTGGAGLVGLADGGTVQNTLNAFRPLFDALPVLNPLAAAASIAANQLGRLRVPSGTNTFSALQLNGESLAGSGIATVMQAAPGAATVLRLGFINAPSQWARRSVRDLVIDGNSKLSDGVTYGAASSTQISGRWAFDGVTFVSCDKGVSKPTGNIGNSYRNANFVRNNYGVYAVGQASPLMHAGNDTYEDVEFSENTLAGAYYDSPISGSGGLIFGKNTIFELNPGFGVFIKNWATSYTPIVFDGAWFEGNASSATVTINGISYTPVDVHLENVAQAVMVNGIMPSVRLINSHLRVDNCFITLDLTAIEKDGNSVLTVSNASVDGGLHRMQIDSITKSSRVAGNFAAAWWAPVRAGDVRNIVGRVTSQTFTASVPFPGSVVIQDTVVVTDGLRYATAGELTILAGQSQTFGAASFSVGKWAMLTIDIKHVSGSLGGLSISQAASGVLIPDFSTLLETGRWKTIACIAPVSSAINTGLLISASAGGNQVVRLSSYQVLEFNTEQEAVDFYNSRGFVL